MLPVVGRIGVWTALAVVAGCGGRSYDTYTIDSYEYRSSRSEVQLQSVEQLVDGERKRMSLAEPLFSGDKTALLLSVPEPLYIYVVNLAPDGSKNIIWPSHSPRKVSGLQRIPEGGGWFTLTGESGPEVIAVVGTRDAQPLAGAGKDRVIALVEKVAATDLTRLQSALPPGVLEAGHATMGVRGHGLSLMGKSVRVASHDPVVMILDIDHRATEP